MKQLLTIETVPISIEYKYKSASESSGQSAKLRIRSANDGVTIKSNPISIRMDSFDSESFGKPVSGGSAASRNLSYDATARYAGSGNIELDIRLLGEKIEGLDYQRIGRSIDSVLGALSPDDPAAATASDLRISFQIGSLPLDQSTAARADISFIPGDLEFEVTELPKVIIRYIGGPIYIPKSADPNYVEPDRFSALA